MTGSFWIFDQWIPSADSKATNPDLTVPARALKRLLLAAVGFSSRNGAKLWQYGASFNRTLLSLDPSISIKPRFGFVQWIPSLLSQYRVTSLSSPSNFAPRPSRVYIRYSEPSWMIVPYSISLAGCSIGSVALGSWSLSDNPSRFSMRYLSTNSSRRVESSIAVV